jgi:hypothetical protein
MDDIVREVEMRVAGAETPGCLEAVAQAIRDIDPDAKVRLDPATGILHAMTSRETLEVTDALTRAGYDVTGMASG